MNWRRQALEDRFNEALDLNDWQPTARLMADLAGHEINAPVPPKCPSPNVLFDLLARLDDAQLFAVVQVMEARQELRETRESLDLMSRKAEHGCTDAYCPECDGHGRRPGAPRSSLDLREHEALRLRRAGRRSVRAS